MNKDEVNSVVRNLRHCTENIGCEWCDYDKNGSDFNCVEELMRDALNAIEYLREKQNRTIEYLHNALVEDNE